MNRREQEALARGVDRIRRLQAEGKLPPGDIGSAARALQLQDRKAAARTELLTWWRSHTPTERAYLQRIAQTGGPEMVKQYAAATGLSPDALSLGEGTFAIHGTIERVFSILDEHAQHEEQQATDAEVRESLQASGGDVNLELAAGELAVALGIEPKKGESFDAAIRSAVREGKVNDPRITSHPGFRDLSAFVQKEDIRDKLSGPMFWDKPKIKVELTKAAQAAERTEARSRAAMERQWEQDAGRPESKALTAARAAAEKAQANPGRNDKGRYRDGLRASLEAAFDEHFGEDKGHSIADSANATTPELEAEAEEGDAA